MQGASKIGVFLWLLAIVLLPVRSANAHLHLCLDGQEQAVSVHLEDVASHHGENDLGHQDRDVKLNGSLSIHKSSLDDDTWVLAGIYVLALVLPEHTPDAPVRVVTLPPLSLAFDLRPPSRGPPA